MTSWVSLRRRRWKRAERERVAATFPDTEVGPTAAKPSARPVISSNDGRRSALVSTRPRTDRRLRALVARPRDRSYVRA
jgi:hypothetical protein